MLAGEQVHDVMGLSLRDVPSVFQLECDRSRARYGVILLAFRFDPPVAADVLGEFDGIGSAMVVSERLVLGRHEDETIADLVLETRSLTSLSGRAKARLTMLRFLHYHCC